MSRSESPPDYCKNCMMPVLPKAFADSNTSFLFASMHCICNTPRMQASENSQNTEFCKTCKKRKPSNASRVGSFTGFLFAATRCKCAKTIASPGNQTNLSSIIQPTKADRTRRGARTKMVQHNKTRRPSRTQALMANESSRAMMSLQPGLEIGGTYQLQEHIGEGGMGSVYSARHMVLNRPCAIKFLMPDMVSESSWQMFKNEAKILNSLNHEGICKIYDLGLHQNALPFLAMELIDGITLDEYLTRFGPLSTGAALQLAAEAARTLAYAHRHNILHRDIKPANIMLARTSSNNIAVKILDFGISQTMAHDENATGDDDIIGSAFYMSPEQFRGDKLTPASDIYSLGCTIFECLTGRPPYDAGDYHRLSDLHQSASVATLQDASGVPMPPALEAVIDHCLQKHPIKRYKNISELALDCQNLLEGKDLQFAAYKNSPDSDQSSISAELSSGERKLRIGLMSSAVLCTIALCGLVYLYYIKPVITPKAKYVDPTIDVPIGQAITDPQFAPGVNDLKSLSAKDLQQEETANRIAGEKFARETAMLGSMQRHKNDDWWAFDFPARLDLGTITAKGLGNKTVNPRMKGKLLIPADSEISLWIHNPYNAQVNTALLKRFNPDCARSLGISGGNTNDLSMLAGWSKLESLTLNYIAISKEMADQIGRCKKLLSISLETKNVLAGDVLKMMQGKQLKILSIKATTVSPSIDAIISDINKYPQLRFLQCPIPTSDDSLRTINSHPKLKKIIFQTEKISKEQIININNICKDKYIAIVYKEPSFDLAQFGLLKSTCKHVSLQDNIYVDE